MTLPLDYIFDEDGKIIGHQYTPRPMPAKVIVNGSLVTAADFHFGPVLKNDAPIGSYETKTVAEIHCAENMQTKPLEQDDDESL